MKPFTVVEILGSARQTDFDPQPWPSEGVLTGTGFPDVADGIRDAAAGTMAGLRSAGVASQLAACVQLTSRRPRDRTDHLERPGLVKVEDSSASRCVPHGVR